MSNTYTMLDDADIAAGKPTKEEIFKRIKDNQECFNEDIELLKQTAVIQIFNLKFEGNINQYSATEVAERVPTFSAPLTGSVNQFKVCLLSPSTSGTLQITLEKSTDCGINWSSMLSAPVELTGDQPGDSSGSVSFSTQFFNQGDLLRIRILGIQVDQGDFHIEVAGEIA